MINPRRDISQKIGAVLAALALVFLIAAPVASAKMPVTATPVDAAAYVLPDGTAPDLCLGGGLGETAGGPHCPLCTLSKTFALPPCCATDQISTPMRVALSARPHSSPTIGSWRNRAQGPRAPPAS